MLADRLRVDQPPDRLVAGDDGGQRDHGDDEHAGEVLGPAVAVGVAAGGGAAAEGERDPQRHGGQRVGEVVDGVGQQRDRSGDQHDGSCSTAVTSRTDQADLQRPDALGAGLQRRVDRVGGVVAVRPQHRPQPAPRRPCPCPWPCAVLHGRALWCRRRVRWRVRSRCAYKFIIPAVRPIWQNWTSNSQLLVDILYADRGARRIVSNFVPVGGAALASESLRANRCWRGRDLSIQLRGGVKVPLC